MDDPIETQDDIIFKLLDQLPNQLPLTITSLPSSKLPVIEICDKQWLAHFQSQTNAVYYSRQLGMLGMPVISLEEAVLVLYRLSGMDSTRIPKEYVDALAELKKRLLYFAIDRRNKGEMREYFAMLPLVSIGALIGLRLNNNHYTGVLRGWVSTHKRRWLCILGGDHETEIAFNCEELEESHIVLSGDMRQLHRELLKIKK
ncbi:uncharacterized protein PV06_11757 [Exophiala oligosperma]|uniref:GST N-terminal domain-containing protein n=2 Tax=Chaetothyriales TaxID=34395 RepID=A0A0D2A6G2_9EURO|nr:uncharacterized protein PV06_11757 [Exophiala oligosperma]KIW35931.1 hypothetical protein PV06_11757 [Exophiala oligosperma]